MKVIEVFENPWFDIAVIYIRISEDEYKILLRYSKIVNRKIEDVLQDAIYLGLGRILATNPDIARELAEKAENKK